MAEHLHPADSLYAESCGGLVQACKTNKMRWSDMIETWDISKPVWYPGWPGDPAGDAEVSLQSSFGFQSPDNEFVSTSRVFWLGLTENEKKMDARVEAKRNLRLARVFRAALTIVICCSWLESHRSCRSLLIVFKEIKVTHR